MLTDAVVDTLIVSAKDDNVLAERELIGHGLVELLAVGCGEDNLVVVAMGGEFADTAVDGLALHHHSCEAAEGVVVDATILADCVVTKVVQVDFY